MVALLKKTQTVSSIAVVPGDLATVEGFFRKRHQRSYNSLYQQFLIVHLPLHLCFRNFVRYWNS